MAWQELIDQRNRKARTFAEANQRMCCCTLAALHYESEPDSGAYDAEIDCTPQRIQNAALDGWRIVANDWHYALGQPGDKSTDGWVGFGGRQGAHWFKFRLARVGYLHWPARAWQDIGGAPTYDRANLSNETRVLTIGPNSDAVNIGSVATWREIWTTPGGGELSVSWRAGDQLKEEIVINQAARGWIRANRPPTTPADETWFGFVFQLDWSDVPRVVRDGIVQDIDGDFADDGERIELRDALDRLLAFMPLDHAFVGIGKQRVEIPLRKRFWRDGDDYYLLIGARTDELAMLADGDLIFDPTVTPAVGANADDALSWEGGNFGTTYDVYLGNYFDEWNNNGLRFQLNVPNGATISEAKLTFTASATLSDDTVRVKIAYQDANDPSDFSGDTYTTFEARTRSATGVDWDFTANWSTDSTYDSDDISTVIQALVNEDYWAANEHCVIFADDDGSTSYAYRTAYSYDNSSSDAVVLTVVYTAGQDHEQPVSDGLSLAETLAKAPGAAIADAIALADTLAKMFGLLPGDGVTLGDSAVSGVGLAAADALSLAESLVNAPGLGVSDGLSLAEALAKSAGLGIADGLSLGDVLTRAWVVALALVDGVSLADAHIAGVGLEFSDGLSLADILTSAWVVARTLTDGLSLGDTRVSDFGLVVTDGLSLTDVLARVWAVVYAWSDDVILNDTHVAGVGLDFADGLSLADTLALVWAAALARSDGLNLGDSPAHDVGLHLADGTNLADALSQAVSLDVLDGLSLSDAADLLSGIGLAILDGLTASDSVAKLAGLGPADGLSLADTLTRAWVAYTTLEDGVDLADVLASSAGLSVTDGLTWADTLVHALGIQRALEDGLSLSDAADLVAGLGLAILDGLNLSDGRAVSVYTELLDGVSLGDVLIQAVGLSVADGLSLAESVARALAIQKEDGISLVDVADLLSGIGLALLDGISLSDSRLASAGKALADGVDLVDDVTLLKAIFRQILDGLTLGDSAAKAIAVEALDGLSLADVVSAGIALYILLTLADRNFTLSLQEEDFTLELLDRIFELRLREQ